MVAEKTALGKWSHLPGRYLAHHAVYVDTANPCLSTRGSFRHHIFVVLSNHQDGQDYMRFCHRPPFVQMAGSPPTPTASMQQRKGALQVVSIV